MTNNTSRLILTILFVYVVTGQDCDNVCYKEVKDGLKLLEELYSKPPVVSNIPPMFEDIHALINATENIISSVRNLDDIKNNSISIQESLSHGNKRLKLLDNIVTNIDAINKTLQDLQQKKEIHNKAFNKCDEASKLYNMLREDVAEIKEYGNNITIAFEGISNRINEIKNKSFDIKQDLDGINIDDGLFQGYLCNSKLQSTIRDVINIMRNIADNLKASFTDVFDSKLKEIETNITQTENDIEEIEKSLTEPLPETDIKITDETRPLLEDLTAQVNDLKNKIKEIKLDKTLEDILEDAKQKLKNLINEYKEILNNIFSKENKDKVKEEIEKAKATLQLLKERDAIKADLEDIKKIVDTLKDRGVCFINETVSVEDK